MGKSGRRRTGALTVMIVFVLLMLSFSGLCWWLWHNRDQGVPTVVFGYELMAMDGDDMEPEFPDGCLLLLNSAAPSSLRSGDAVVYGRSGGQGGIVVRVLNLTTENGKADSLLVKADKGSASVEISPDEVNSRVVGNIPLLGSFWNFLMTGKGLLTVIAGPCVLFFLVELILLICYARSGASRTSEGPEGLKRKVSSHLSDDRKENFVDVTARYTGESRGRTYQSPLRQEMDSVAGGPAEDVPLDSLTDQYADLDFNPVIREDAPSGVESVEIPDASPAVPVLAVTLDGKEAARFSLSGPQEVCVKTPVSE